MQISAIHSSESGIPLSFLGSIIFIHDPEMIRFCGQVSPLHLAAKLGYTNVCECLIELGSNVHHQDRVKQTAMHMVGLMSESTKMCSDCEIFDEAYADRHVSVCDEVCADHNVSVFDEACADHNVSVSHAVCADFQENDRLRLTMTDRVQLVLVFVFQEACSGVCN